MKVLVLKNLEYLSTKEGKRNPYGEGVASQIR